MGEIKEFYGVPNEIPTDVRSLIDAFPDWLTEAAKRGGILLVLDALNQLEDRDKVPFWSNLLTALISEIMFCIPGRGA